MWSWSLVIAQVNCDDPGRIIVAVSTPTVHCPLPQQCLPLLPTQYAAHLNNNYPLLTLSHSLTNCWWTLGREYCCGCQFVLTRNSQILNFEQGNNFKVQHAAAAALPFRKRLLLFCGLRNLRQEASSLFAPVFSVFISSRPPDECLPGNQLAGSSWTLRRGVWV